MLIRWATENDLPAWRSLATEVSPIFRHPADMGSDPEFLSYAQSKTGKYEALTAVDYRTGRRMGFIGFSRANNRITWLAVGREDRRKSVGTRLLRTALRQLDPERPITVETYPEGYGPGAPAKALYRKSGFVETESGLAGPYGVPICRMTLDLSGQRRGGSFHYRYPAFAEESREGRCPVCLGEPSPEGQTEIEAGGAAWAVAEYPGQGRLFGKMYVMPRGHAVHFEDMPETDMAAWMREVQRIGRALRQVTGAVKINYELHGNSGAHLHIHLFPRYLDDEFPSAPIDYRLAKPAPYEDYDEFLWFVDRMREELGKKSAGG